MASHGQARPSGTKMPRIDWTHPLTDGLLHYAWDTGGNLLGARAGNTHNKVDLITGTTYWMLGSTPPTVGASQYGTSSLYSSNAADGWGSWSFIQAATAAGNYSFACAFIKTAVVPANCIVFGRTANNGASAPYANWQFCINQSSAGQGAFAAFVDSGGNSALAPNGAISDNTFTSAVGTLSGGNGNSTLSVYINGAFATATPSNIFPHSTNTQDNVMFASASGAGMVNSFYGMLFYGAFWARVLTPSEILQLHLDPYCFLLFDLDELPSVPRSGTGTQAWLTQIGLEQWAQGTPNAQLTQIAVEQWAAAATGNTLTQLTQIGLEQWASVASATPGGAQARAIILA